mgnify:CR=1 FL=1
MEQSPPEMVTVQRDPANPCALTFFFVREPTDEEVRGLAARVCVAKEELPREDVRPARGDFW